jgi:hypothetical protein
MASAKDKLNPKPKPAANRAEGAVQLQVNPPVVKVGAPQITVDVPAPQLNMDSKPFADVVSQLGQTMARLAQQQLAILSAIEQQTEALRQLATRTDPAINVPAPVVKMAARPRDFYVELDKENGETVGMRVSAEASH